MKDPDMKEIMSMFLLVTKLVMKECGTKDTIKLKAMQYALVSAAEAIAEELKESAR